VDGPSLDIEHEASIGRASRLLKARRPSPLSAAVAVLDNTWRVHADTLFRVWRNVLTSPQRLWRYLNDPRPADQARKAGRTEEQKRQIREGSKASFLAFAKCPPVHKPPRDDK
jgi:hypothetical protein